MNPTKNLGLICALVALAGLSGIMARAQTEEGIAVAIVYDTSGSMKEPVRDKAGKSSPKNVIASRALGSVVDRLQKFGEASKDQKLWASLVVFDRGGAREQIKLGEFKPEAFREALRSMPDPKGGTPLGASIRVAADSLLSSPLKHKHILVVTDGLNTEGPDPASVIPQLRQNAAGRGMSLGIHFVAFDVAAKVFAPLKKLDVTVVSAADEPQLGAQLSYILEEKILLEDEEPPAKKP